MSNKRIEAGLDQSLGRQIGTRQLDASFNAAVWKKIAAEEAAATVPRRSAPTASRWLMVSNGLGVAVSLVLMIYFVVRAMTGVDLAVEVSMPVVSTEMMQGIGWCLTALALGFGLAFTPIGRRVRNLLD
jgi:hypothetical protein